MESKSRVEDWIAASTGAFEMSGALGSSDATVNTPNDHYPDHVFDVSNQHTAKHAAITNDGDITGASITGSEDLGTTKAGRGEYADEPHANFHFNQAVPVDEGNRSDLQTSVSERVPMYEYFGLDSLGTEDVANGMNDPLDGQSLSRSLWEASRQPLPESTTQSNGPSRKSSLDALLAARGYSAADANVVPLPASVSSSVSQEGLGFSANVTNGNKTTKNTRSSLQVLLSNEDSFPDARLLSLPSSEGERSEASSLRDLLLQNPKPNPRTPNKTSTRPLTPPSYLPYVYDYPGLIDYCKNLFPHIKTGNMAISEKRTRHNYVNISCLDYDENSGFSSTGLSVDERDKLEIPLDIFKWSLLPIETTTRLLVVQDLSPRTISLLGQVFGMHPEFFEEHLVNSGYRKAKYNEPSPSTWNSAGMGKHYSSVRWFRPVSRLKVPPFSRGSQIDLLKSPGARLEYPSGDSYLAETNIFRSEWSLSTEPTTSVLPDRRPIGWEERATLFEKNIGNCTFVILLLDPLPTLAEEEEFVTRVVLRRKLARQSRPVRRQLTTVERISRNLWVRKRKGRTKKDTEKRPDLGIDKPQSVSSLSTNEKEFGRAEAGYDPDETFRPDDEETTIKSRNFTRVASIPVFEQSISRMPLDSSNYDYSSLFNSEAVKLGKATDLMSQRTLEEIAEIQDPNKAKSTREDFIERLKEFEKLDYTLFGNFACAEPLILLIIRDNSHFLTLIHRALDNISRDILDDAKIEASLLLWRQILYRCQRELPDIEKSIRNFIGFCTSFNRDRKAAEVDLAMEELSKEIDLLLERVDKVSSSLVSNMALLESKRGIAEAESVTKLTELAFLFIPLSFASSIFGMQITNFTDRAPLSDFVVLAILILAFSYGLRLLIRSRPMAGFQEYFLSNIRWYSEKKRHRPLRRGQPIPTSTAVNWIIYKSRVLPGTIYYLIWYFVTKYVPVFWAGTGFVIKFLVWMALLAVFPLALIWTRSIPFATKSIITATVLLILLPVVMIPLWQKSTREFRAGLPIMIRQSWLALGLTDGQAIFAIVSIGINTGPLVALWKSGLAVGAKISITFAILIFVCPVVWFLVFATGMLQWLPEPSPLVPPIDVDDGSEESSLPDD